MSRRKQKVRARAISRSKVRSFSVISSDWLVTSGWLKSAAGALHLDPRLLDHADERRGRTVEDRQLGAVHLDAAVVDPHAVERRHDVLDGGDARIPDADGGREGRVEDVLVPRGDLDREVHPDEGDPGVRRGRGEGDRHGPARVQANTRRRHALRNCSLTPVGHFERTMSKRCAIARGEPSWLRQTSLDLNLPYTLALRGADLGPVAGYRRSAPYAPPLLPRAPDIRVMIPRL
jgi:hypothetical protein